MKSNNIIQSEAVNIGIYKMTNNINGKKYFGQTSRPIEERFKEHCTSPYPIGCAIRKYGPKNFSIKLIIKNIDSQEAANDIEKHLIREFDTLTCSGHGYNVAEGGYGNPFAGMSEEKKREHSRKISEGNKGKKRSEETKAKIGKAQKGKPKTEETKAKIGKAQKGKPRKPRKPLSEEAKIKMSEAQIGKKRGPYKPRTKPNKNKNVPKIKLNKNKGVPRQPRSEEHKRKLSEVQSLDLSSFSSEEISLIKDLRSQKVSTRKISTILFETFNRKLSHETIRKYF